MTKLHLWFPSIFNSKGGIQVYSSFLLQALQNIYPKAQYDVFLKHDFQTSPDIKYLPKTRFHFVKKFLSKFSTPLFASKIIIHGLLKSPDLVISTHVNFAKAAHYLKRLNGTPYWVVAHGIDAWNITDPELQAALEAADRILCVSNYTRTRLLLEQNIDQNKVLILFNTFEPNRFKIASKPLHLLKKYKLKPEQQVILTVTRLSNAEGYKGYEQILQALPKIKQQVPDVHYILVGKGNDIPRIEGLIAQLNLQDSVTLAGFVPDEELHEYYNLCDVFAMPSQKEGFGIVYLEALASGKPTLAGNQDGSVDPLCNGELGALVNPCDVDEIGDTLIKILNGTYSKSLMYQPEVLRQMVINKFGFERFQEVVGELIQNHAP
ncbi:glycosyltransferase [Calothrix sp. HK-06]|nr:glycosyltransferase [Calothrix sp. HK-06]